MRSVFPPKKIQIRMYLLAGSIAFCTGCFCPPVDEKLPTYDLNNSWKNTSSSSTISTEFSVSPDTWWEVFQDKNLNAIVEEGLQNSPSIEQALARFEQAMFLAKVTRADQFPQLAVNGYGDRRRIPQSLQSSASVPTGNFITPTTPAPIPVPNTGVPPIVIPPIIVPAIPEMKTVKTPTYVNDLIANLLISYELDFWGKYYLKTQAAIRRSEEAEADLATSRLLLVDQIAATYFTIQAMEYQISLIRDEILMHEKRNGLLFKQCQNGLKNTFQLLDEQASLETKKTDEQSLIQSRDVNYSLLAVLVGREPNVSSFDIAQDSWRFPVVPIGIPSSLLAQRPDIRTHMKEVEAIIAEIGAAKTELLPSISLSAAAGYQAGVAHEWFKWKNRIWSLASSLSQPLFDAGQRFAQVDATKARFREAASVLTQTVLNSVKEVEDALIAIRTQNERRIAAIKRENDLANTTLLRADLCTTGVQDYLIVLQANENLSQAKRARVNEEFNLQLGTLALIKSLGGSWSEPSQAISV
jgi:NodT family efflux transporter outer membrane factor (OMF) lipoprotein